MEPELVALSEAVGSACRARKLLIATAESCTGGWAAQVITHTPGSSAWFERGFITYTNDSKTDMLGVRMNTITQFGAVSPETAGEMAQGALENSRAAISLAITGIAGPTGGSPDKPVGTVCFGWCIKGRAPSCQSRLFSGDRESIRRQSVIHALAGLQEHIREIPQSNNL
ncbi:MAG: nicotinamide-nucleotide amidohydrolase family protein [Gammaproteobacteria bacterium]|nr:nicotinamide-nucleotide amidohydrolase family protein [Gammaproteobacteria bacterium]MBU3990004.1 nicotinamide-nucleotide amidohydrolase family protein [Gammaproteobacteria bacterium]MBU4005656.1 nicotinamide-nucleotide amidohydrolase family protein [Gammaproteobacteria bacterium]MBU4020791.1 nicotinamide-nucleotide amidohydrolase family protein [Gammaproteobacteria bacterium]MBU4096610.1 nicotinamide-nucleotide amidohydrolase family protein [Gammaproteobacteria bacterium]